MADTQVHSEETASRGAPQSSEENRDPRGAPSSGSMIQPTDPVISPDGPAGEAARELETIGDVDPAPEGRADEPATPVTPLDENPPDEQISG